MAEKKTRRRVYLKDFCKSEDGSYIYKGNVYSYQGQAKRLLLIKVRLWLLCVCMLAALTVSGCIAAPGMDHCLYVLLPYALGLLAGLSAAWALFRFSAGGHPLREYVYLASVPKIPFRALLGAAGSGLAAVGEILFVFQNGSGEKSSEFFLFLASEIISCACAALIYRIAGKTLTGNFSCK